MTVDQASSFLLERYELKYLLTPDLVEPISNYVELFCQLDYYSKISEDFYYTINSLYFDSDDFKIFNFKQNDPKDRVSLRLRSYGHNPQIPYFFEVKKKHDQIVRKLRGKVFEKDLNLFVQNFLGGQASIDPKSQIAIDQFFYWSYVFQAAPKILTQYRRKAYFSTVDDYARVTFDTNLRYHAESSWNVIPDESQLKHYDHSGIYKDNASLVILELKSTTRVPYWMIDLIRYFDLQRRSISKFESAMLSEFSNEEMISSPRIFQLPRSAW